MHAVPADGFKTHEELLDKVRQVAAWLGTSQDMLETLHPDRQPPPARRPRRQQRVRRPRLKRTPEVVDEAVGQRLHQIVAADRGWKCSYCSRFARAHAERQRPERQVCTVR